MRVDENAAIIIKDIPFMQENGEELFCDAALGYEPNSEIWQNGYSTCFKEVRD